MASSRFIQTHETTPDSPVLRPRAEKTALKLGDGKVASSLFSPRMIGDRFKQGFSGPLFMWVLSGLGTCCPSCSFGAIFLGHLCLGDQEPSQTAENATLFSFAP
jgi:hypothetical protein